MEKNCIYMEVVISLNKYVFCTGQYTFLVSRVVSAAILAAFSDIKYI